MTVVWVRPSDSTLLALLWITAWNRPILVRYRTIKWSAPSSWLSSIYCLMRNSGQMTIEKTQFRVYFLYFRFLYRGILWWKIYGRSQKTSPMMILASEWVFIIFQRIWFIRPCDIKRKYNFNIYHILYDSYMLQSIKKLSSALHHIKIPKLLAYFTTYLFIL